MKEYHKLIICTLFCLVNININFDTDILVILNQCIMHEATNGPASSWYNMLRIIVFDVYEGSIHIYLGIMMIMCRIIASD